MTACGSGNVGGATIPADDKTETTENSSEETEAVEPEVSAHPAQLILSNNYVTAGYSAVYEQDGISYYDVTVTNKTDFEMGVDATSGGGHMTWIAAGETITISTEPDIDVSTSHSGTDTSVSFKIQCRSSDGTHNSSAYGWIRQNDDGSYDTLSAKYNYNETDENSGEWEIEGQANVNEITAPTEVVNDDWIKATTTNVDYAYTDSTIFRFGVQLSTVNQSGKTLVLDDDDHDYVKFANGSEIILGEDHYIEQSMTRTFDFYVWDESEQQAYAKDAGGTYYEYTVGRHYTVTVSCEGGKLSISSTYEAIDLRH